MSFGRRLRAGRHVVSAWSGVRHLLGVLKVKRGSAAAFFKSFSLSPPVSRPLVLAVITAWEYPRSSFEHVALCCVNLLSLLL